MRWDIIRSQVETTLRALLADIEPTIEISECDFPPEDTFGYDDERANEEACAFVRAMAERTPWGWCDVAVIVEWRGWRGRATLGGCNYDSEADFKRGDYYTAMVSEAFDELVTSIVNAAQRSHEAISDLGVIL